MTDLPDERILSIAIMCCVALTYMYYVSVPREYYRFQAILFTWITTVFTILMVLLYKILQ